MRFRRRNSEALADLICGNVGSYEPGPDVELKYFLYRSSSYITEFFQELDTDWVHDPLCLIDHLMIASDAMNEGSDRPNALRQLNEVLAREGFEAFYGDDRHCYLPMWARTLSRSFRRILTAR